MNVYIYILCVHIWHVNKLFINTACHHMVYIGVTMVYVDHVSHIKLTVSARCTHNYPICVTGISFIISNIRIHQWTVFVTFSYKQTLCEMYYIRVNGRTQFLYINGARPPKDWGPFLTRRSGTGILTQLEFTLTELIVIASF